jgi:hypothetical protein
MEAKYVSSADGALSSAVVEPRSMEHFQEVVEQVLDDDLDEVLLAKAAPVADVVAAELPLRGGAGTTLCSDADATAVLAWLTETRRLSEQKESVLLLQRVRKALQGRRGWEALHSNVDTMQKLAALQCGRVLRALVRASLPRDTGAGHSVGAASRLCAGWQRSSRRRAAAVGGARKLRARWGCAEEREILSAHCCS